MNYFDTLFAKKLAGGGSSPNLEEVTKSYTANGDDVILPGEGYDGISKVNVSVNVSGGAEAPENDVEFIDYDGTIVYSYTAQEFLALDAMPANPTHEGLTAQGWNWALADAKEYVGKYGKIVIGQLYVTDDGKTRIYVKLDNPDLLSPTVGIAPNGTAHIDWGDGTGEDVTGTSTSSLLTQTHTYSATGEYIISITSPQGENPTLGIMGNYNSVTSTLFYGKLNQNTTTPSRNTVYTGCVYKIELGLNLSLQNRVFSCFYNMKTITIPSNCEFSGGYTFYRCSLLTSIIIPSSWVFDNTGDSGNTFGECYNLKCISFPKSSSVSRNIIIPSSCEKLTFPDVVANVPTPFSVNSYVVKYLIQSTGSQIGSLQSCYSLQTIIVGDKITSLVSSAFNGQAGVKNIKFIGDTPPTQPSSSGFNGLRTDCKIYVPYSEDHSVLNAYKTATNYPNPSTYTYVEY